MQGHMNLKFEEGVFRTKYYRSHPYLTYDIGELLTSSRVACSVVCISFPASADPDDGICQLL